MMKRFISSVLALGVCLTPLSVPVMVQPSWAQSQNSQSEKILTLLRQAEEQEKQGKPLQAIETLQQLLAIARQLKDKKLEATALVWLGRNYYDSSQNESALNYYNQALSMFREERDRSAEAAALTNIGVVYLTIGKPQQGLDYFNQALSIQREEGDRAAQASILTNIGAFYRQTGQP